MSTSRLRLIHARYRRTCGVVRFAASPAYKLRAFERLVSERVHASSNALLHGTFEGLLLVGLGTDTRGVEITSALGLGESATDWSAA